MQSVAPGLHIHFPNSQQEIQTCISLPVSALDRPSQDPTTTNNTAHKMLQTYPVSSRQDAAAAAVKMHCIALSYSSQPQSMPSGAEKVPERQAVLSNKQESSHRPREQKKKKPEGREHGNLSPALSRNSATAALRVDSLPLPRSLVKGIRAAHALLN